MDPDDFPASTTISPKCIELWANPDFEDTFLAEMSEHENDLCLDDMCEGSAYMAHGEMPHFSDLKFTSRNRPVVEGSFRVEFMAERPSGCKDHPIPFPVDTRHFFKLDLRSGEVVFDQPQTYGDYGH